MGSSGSNAAPASALYRTATAAGAAAAASCALAAAWRRWGTFKRSQEDTSLQSVFPRPGARKSIPPSEVASHTTVRSAWIIIRGQVYDVTPWLERHPGGRMLLLACAGRDATELFDLIGHSALAKTELRRLLVGELGGGLSTVPPSATSPTVRRNATLTGGRKATSSTEALPDVAGISANRLWEVDSHGFLPCRDPVSISALDGTVFEVFAELAEMIPAMGVSGELRQLLDGDSELQKRMLRCGNVETWDQLSEDQLERAFSILGFMMVMYLRGGSLDFSMGICLCGGAEAATAAPIPTTGVAPEIPNFLGVPLLKLSEWLERPPMVDYAASVLYNWQRVDPNGPISPSNIRCVVRLTGLMDEEWFFKTHVIIESEAGAVMSAVISASQSEDESDLLECLVSLEQALWRVVRACLPIMYERGDDGVPKCSEHVFYQILRPLIKSGTVVFRGADGEALEYSITGPSGAMSTLLPCIDALLGIQTTSPKLREALQAFELSMPLQHREFLAKLRAQQSIRQRILLNSGVGVERAEQYDALVRAFNRCIARVLDFRWQHWQYVKQFIMKPGNLYHATGSGGTSFDYLQQHITDTERAQLTLRGEARTPSPGPEVPIKMAPATSPQPQEFWSVDGARGLLSRDPCESPEAAWASDLPAAVRKAMKVVWDTAKRMPSIVAVDGPFLEYVEGLRERLQALQDERALASLPEVAREHLMTTLGHVRAGCLAVSSGNCCPQCVDRPLQVVARSVGRPPRLDLANLVLTNWRLVETQNQSGQGGSERLGSAFRFLSAPDEECYRTLHIVLHEEARHAVAAIRSGQNAMREQNDKSLVDSTGHLSLWINRVCDFFDSYFEQKDSRTESMMMVRLAKVISQSNTSTSGGASASTSGAAPGLELECASWVYLSGASLILPAIQAFLGVDMLKCKGKQPLSSCMEQLAGELRLAMPVPHRLFLEELERGGMSVRGYCFRRFGTKAVSVEVLHDLESAFNDAVNALVRYLSRRNHLVQRYFPQLSSNFGSFHTEVERYMRRSRLQLLKMRQRAHQALEEQ